MPAVLQRKLPSKLEGLGRSSDGRSFWSRHSLLAPVLALLACWLLTEVMTPSHWSGDLDIYRNTAKGILADGLLPYKDIVLEYPPMALLPILAGAIGGFSEVGYAAGFSAVMALSLVATQLVTAWIAKPQGRAVAWLFVLLPPLLARLLWERYDIFPVALAIAGLALLIHGYRTPPANRWLNATNAGFALLAIGTAAKMFPAIIAVIGVIWLCVSDRRGVALRGAIVFTALIIVSTLPFFLLSPDGFLFEFKFHLRRPPQIESFQATVIAIVGGSHVSEYLPYKSHGFLGGYAKAIGLGISVLGVFAMGAVALLARRWRYSVDGLIAAAFAGMLAFVVFNKVLSPQYLIWLVPFAAIAWFRGARISAGLVAVALFLTFLEYPNNYMALRNEHWDLLVLVGVRNLLLLMAFIYLLLPLFSKGQQEQPPIEEKQGMGEKPSVSEQQYAAPTNR